MARYPLFLGTDDGIMLVGPTDVRDPTTPVAIETAITADVRIYDDQDQPLIVMHGDSVVDTDSFKVLGSDLFAVDTKVSVRDSNNDVHDGTVTDVDDDTNSITLDNALSGGVFVPNRTRFFVATEFTPDTLSIYGTPVALGKNWGYYATIGNTHPGLYHGQDVIAEVDFDGGAGLRSVTYIECVVRRANT